ncbi:MAG TPA: LmeA family phospholipid-binding protein [Jatrophihabitans sp.]|jgi:hypothetical protein
MIIDLLLSKDGLRLDSVDVKLTGVRIVRGNGGFMARVAERIDGSLRLYFDDLTAALARPEIVDQVMSGVAGIAKPEITLANGKDGGVRIVGSVEALGRRIPITTSTRVHIEQNKVIISATHLEGLPILRSIPLQLLDLVLPLSLPEGISLTKVTTDQGCFVISFDGNNVPLTPLTGDGDAWVF